MNRLLDIKGYKEKGIVIDPNETHGDVIELHGLLVVLPKQPAKKDILFHDLPKNKQFWRRVEVPSELSRIKKMDEWMERPQEFRNKYSPFIEKEFKRRRDRVWFYNNGVPTYITGRNYMFLQWTKMDIGYRNFLS